MLPWREYEKVRKERIRKIVEVKKRRRLELGERLTLLFENRDLDRLEKPEQIQREIEVYSTLLPCNGKVKATLYVNAEDFDDLFWVFKNLAKIYNSVYLKVRDKLIQGVPEAGREQGEAFSTVQYLTFDLEGERSTDMEVHVIHENYRYSVKVPEELARELIREAYEEC